MRIAQWTGLWALLCLCSFVAPGVADADRRIERAQAVAAKAWDDPCPGQVHVSSAPPLQPTWLAATVRSACQITLSDREPWPWSQLCPVLLHEYGHLAGYRDPLNPADPFHSQDPNHIMYAFLRPDRRCRDYGTPYLGYPPPAGFERDPEQAVGAGFRRSRALHRRGRGAAQRRGAASRRPSTLRRK